MGWCEKIAIGVPLGVEAKSSLSQEIIDGSTVPNVCSGYVVSSTTKCHFPQSKEKLDGLM